MWLFQFYPWFVLYALKIELIRVFQSSGNYVIKNRLSGNIIAIREVIQYLKQVNSSVLEKKWVYPEFYSVLGFMFIFFVFISCHFENKRSGDHHHKKKQENFKILINNCFSFILFLFLRCYFYQFYVVICDILFNNS